MLKLFLGISGAFVTSLKCLEPSGKFSFGMFSEWLFKAAQLGQAVFCLIMHLRYAIKVLGALSC